MRVANRLSLAPGLPISLRQWRTTPSRVPDFLTGISVRLIATIILVIMIVEVVIYLPSVSNFRANWLEQQAVGRHRRGAGARCRP